jgi:ABC-2 type transport system permease protein
VLRKMSAFLIRDFLEEMGYPLTLAMRWGNILFKLVTFFFLGKLVAGAILPQLAPYGGSYFPFVMLGLALASFQGVALTAISGKVLYGMYSGTLEAMLVTPTSLSTIVFASMLNQFFSALVLLYLVFSFLFFGVSLGQANLPATAVLMLLALLAHLPIGILSAGFVLLLKRGDPVTLILGQVSALLGGVYFPLQVLPHWLQIAAQFLPFTHALEGLRQAVLNGKGLGDLSPQVVILSLFAAVLLPLSLAFFALTVRQAQRLGTLSQF